MATKDKIKLVAVGDGCCGLTCLLIQFNENRFPTEFTPTIFEHYEADIVYEGKLVITDLWDTSGVWDYDDLNMVSYMAGTDIFLICYDITNPDSFDAVADKVIWGV